MPSMLTMPKLSPTMESGVIAKWHKKVGDTIKPGDVLFEVSTDKATVEHEALDEGILRKILVNEGDEANVNDPIAVMTETADESIDGYEVAKKKASPVASEKAPDKEGPESVAPNTPKGTPGVMAQPIFIPEAPLQDFRFHSPREAVEGRVIASPLARKLARDKGLDISSVQGSGPSGRIMSSDLKMAQPAADVAFGPGKRPDTPPGTFEEEKLSPMRKIIGQRLQEAKTFIPHFYTRQQINAEPMLAIREQLLASGVKLTYNDFVIRACALALRQHPVINSGFNSVIGSIIRFKTIDICVAVSVDGGLITPIIRHADYKNLGELSLEVRALATRAKSGKLEAHEYKGGSFTISNLGMFGIDEFSAIINPPQAAILAVGAVLDTPVIRNAQVVASKTMNVVISSDHRVIDGVAAAQFLQTLKKYLENPASLLI